jgi:hypothetical protein
LSDLPTSALNLSEDAGTDSASDVTGDPTSDAPEDFPADFFGDGSGDFWKDKLSSHTDERKEMLCRLLFGFGLGSGVAHVLHLSGQSSQPSRAKLEL